MAQSQQSETTQPHISRNLSRAVVALYLAAIALLPWTWFPPFPWLHEHAQWSDVVFAAAAALWAVEQWLLGRIPPLRPAHAALALYFLFASLSFLLAGIDRGASAWKLLGIAELCAFAFITSDIATRPAAKRAIAWTVTVTSLATAAAAVAGLLLFYAGAETRLIGIYGELEPSRWYARVQAGFFNPNLLASFCIFAFSIVSQSKPHLSSKLRRVTLIALGLTACLTFSRGLLGFILAAAISKATTRRSRLISFAVAIALFGLMICLTLWKPSVNPTRPLDTRLEFADSSRYSAITSSLRTLAANPLWGSGLDTHPGSYRGQPFDAHCTPVNIAATLGLPALIAVTSLIFIIWRKRKRPTDLALWGGLAGIALDCLAQDVEEFRHVWVMIGLADADSSDDREVQSESVSREEE